MPLPIPFYLRDNQTIPLTHTQLDGNFTILNSKIDNTTCNNIGNGVGIFESKQTGTNDGIMNLYSLSGTNGVSVGVSGTTLVIDGSGAADSDWVTNNDDIYNGNTGNVGIGATNPKTKLELYSTGNTVAINNILRFTDNDTVVTPFQEQFIGKIEFHSNENSGNGGVKSYIGGVQNSAAGSSIIFATTGGTDGTLEGANPQDLIGERMRIDPVGNVGIGIGVIPPGVPVVSAKLHINNTTTEPSFLVEDSVHPDSTPFIISSGGSVSIGATDAYFVGSSKTKLQVTNGHSGVPLSGLPISTTAIFESDSTNSSCLFSPDTNISQIYFGTPSDVFGANIRWDYPNKEFIISTNNISASTVFKTNNGVEAVRIDPVGNVGIGTDVPTEKLHVSGGDFLVETSNGKFYTGLDDTDGPAVRLSGNSSDLIFLGVSDVGTNGMGIGTRGDTEPSYPGYGKQGDGFVYSSADQNGLNIISQIGANKEDYIRFYAGKDADGTTPNIHIHGTGTTKGFVGINTENPTKRLHISGDTLSEGDIFLPDDYKLRIGSGGDLLIYHDGLNSYIGEVGSGNLLLSGTELKLNDSATGKSFLQGNSALSNVKLYWSGDSRITTSEDGLVLDKVTNGTSVANLSVRADGTIITGGTAPIGTHTTVDAQTDPNTEGINIVYYTSTSGGGTITIGDSNNLPVGFKTELIRTSTTTAATVGSSGTSTINGSTTKSLPTAVYSVTTCIANGNAWYCYTGTIL